VVAKFIAQDTFIKKIRFPQPLRFFLTNAIWVTKNVEFDADLESVEKLQKTHAKKVINEKVTEKSNSASNFAFYKTHMKLYKNLLPMRAFFLSLSNQNRTKRLKKRETYSISHLFQIKFRIKFCFCKI
jgi:hypothetical protein